MEQEVAPDEYRRLVRGAHEEAFKLHGAALGLYEEFVLVPPMVDSSVVALAVDIFMRQALVSHTAVAVLVEHGLMEDAATITRRVWELCVQGLYVTGDDDIEVTRPRAGRFLAYLWRELSPQGRAAMAPNHLREWEARVEPYKGLVPERTNQWGPPFMEMCTKIEAENVYDDYRMLSSLAHGSNERFLVEMPTSKVRVQLASAASVLLVYSARYLVALGDNWSLHHTGPDKARVKPLHDALAGWRTGEQNPAK